MFAIVSDQGGAVMPPMPQSCTQEELVGTTGHAGNLGQITESLTSCPLQLFFSPRSF